MQENLGIFNSDKFQHLKNRRAEILSEKLIEIVKMIRKLGGQDTAGKLLGIVCVKKVDDAIEKIKTFGARIRVRQGHGYPLMVELDEELVNQSRTDDVIAFHSILGARHRLICQLAEPVERDGIPNRKLFGDQNTAIGGIGNVGIHQPCSVAISDFRLTFLGSVLQDLNLFVMKMHINEMVAAVGHPKVVPMRFK